MIPVIEFSVGDRVTHRENDSFVKSVVVKVIQNPIDNKIEYRCSRYIQKGGGKRTSVRCTLYAHQIKESKEYVDNGPKKLKEAKPKGIIENSRYFVGKNGDGRGFRVSVK